MPDSVPNGSSRVYRNQHPYKVQAVAPHSKAAARLLKCAAGALECGGTPPLLRIVTGKCAMIHVALYSSLDGAWVLT